jgi:hygromycin-B 4-O-kinase
VPDVTLTPARVARFLRDELGLAIGEVSRIGHGEWSAAFAFDSRGTPLVIRFSQFPTDFQKDALAASFASPALPVPRVLRRGEGLGASWALSERISGAYLDALDEGALRRALPALFASLDAMRGLDLHESQGFGLWDATGEAPHATWRGALLDLAMDRPGGRLPGWRAQLTSSPTGGRPFATAYGAMAEMLSVCPEERYLVHADLLNFNVLVSGARIAAVLDWGAALYGDFLYDIAWLIFWQPWYPAWAGIDFAGEARRHYAQTGVGVSNFGARLRCYALAIGLDNQAYCAYRGRWDQLAEVATRTMRFARGEIRIADQD